jgi:hypothetical protein
MKWLRALFARLAHAEPRTALPGRLWAKREQQLIRTSGTDAEALESLALPALESLALPALEGPT